MRPLYLTMTAFGTYTDKTEIDFSLLGENGLYLITGKTGSGKTTIFDAICYALYGKPSGRNITGEMMRSKYVSSDVQTEVSLLFSHHSKEYKVIRRPGRSVEGSKTKIPESAELYKPNGVIVSKKQDVNAEIKDLLGINVDEFCQISMLAQGNFLKFLLSDTKEKEVILRTVFKTSFYQELQDRLKSELNNIFSNYKNNLFAIKTYIKAINTGSDEERQSRIAYYVEHYDNPADRAERFIEKMLAEDNAFLSELKNKNEKLDEALTDLNLSLGRFEEIQKSLLALEEVKKRLDSLEVQKEKLSSESGVAKKELERKDEIISEISLIESDRDNYEKTETFRLEYEQEEKEGKISAKKLERDKSDLSEAEKRYEDCRREYSKLEFAGENSEKYKVELERVREKRERLKELCEKIALCNTYKEELKDKQRIYLSDKEKYNKYLNRYNERYQAFLDSGAGILADLLEEGKPCPVCGSTSHPHPAVKHPFAPTEEELKKERDMLDSLQDAEVASYSKCAALKAKADSLTETVLKEAKEKIGINIDIDKEEEKIKELSDIFAEECGALEKKISEEEANKNRKKELYQSINEYEKKIKEIREKVSAEELALQVHRSTWREKKKLFDDLAKTLRYRSYEEAKNAVNEKRKEIRRLEENYDKAEERLKKVMNEIHNCTGQKESLEKNTQDSGSADGNVLRENIEKIRSEMQNNNEEIKKINIKISGNTNVLQNLKKENEKCAEIEQKYLCIKSLSDTANGTLADREKITFEAFVQATFFDRVLRRANIRLRSMTSGMFELRRSLTSDNKRSKAGLNLDITDYYNGTVRSVKTLSGGESFMASLSLALGLSDEIQSNAGGVEIETMFVDEGFGSLDSETLEKAYNTLISVTEGKGLVGIISHVEALKSKIDKQIIVEKNSEGRSSVRMKLD